MKKFLVLLAIILLPNWVSAEEIHSFISDITLSRDGTFNVTETILYDFEDAERHGIFRFIPTDHFQGATKRFYERWMEIDVTSVMMDGQPAPFEINHEQNEIKIKIGDPDLTISGEHTYVIDYVVRGGLSFYDSGEVDLYWNATGNDWGVPINNALVRVHDGAGVTRADTSCYFGPIGSTEECEISTSEVDVTEFGPVALMPGEGITIAQALKPDTVQHLILERLSLWPFWLMGSILWFIGLIWFVYRYYVQHRTNASIIPQYEPYENFKPMYTGLLFDGRIDPRDITAGIVYLAEQGFFKIKRIGRKQFFFIEVDDYEITLQRLYTDLESDFQKKIFTLLFEPEATVGTTVVLSELAKNTAKQKKNYQTMTELKAAAENDLLAQGFFEYRWKRLISITLWLAGLLVVLLGLMLFIGAAVAIPLVIAGVTLFGTIVLLLFVYRRRTKKGYQASDYLQGFKQFLTVTDAERFKFHNAPKKSPEQFMEYLPYAIAFGVEKEWAAVFKDITIPNPNWYEGQGATFNALYLSQSLGTFGTAVTTASGHSPASSGGGSSGGGGGGGGGGSW